MELMQTDPETLQEWRSTLLGAAGLIIISAALFFGLSQLDATQSGDTLGDIATLGLTIWLICQTWVYVTRVRTPKRQLVIMGVTFIQDENDFLHMVELVRFKGDSFTIVEEMLDAAERWGSEPSAPLTLGVEDSQIWKAIKPLFEKRMAERLVYPPASTVKPMIASPSGQ